MTRDHTDVSESTAQITVKELLDGKSEALELELLTPEVGLDRIIADSDISSPGLALSGYTERFPEGRTQVFGETEMRYLASLDAERSKKLLGGLFRFAIPVVFVTKGLPVSEDILSVARAHGVPLVRTALTTREFYRRVKPYLEGALAPTTQLHGSLADVYGVGLLFMGTSGVGKSECVLDLVERGHRLVADDLVMVSRRGADVLIGQGHELQGHNMEIRGLGIIDVGALFGIRAIRQQKRLEVIVQLERWVDGREYTRTGLDTSETDVLGVPIPTVTIPLNPGKNITVISEVVAMNHLLKYSGVDAATAFDQRLQDAMQPVKAYLEQDYE
ncbi:MAG: HPr(Ser) kinase/phosphatase [Gemmatimonadota bacterium]|nr:MAG: HPr(Ser) kinase/phosphatase [Gemmatimonadota bacterium]